VHSNSAIARIIMIRGRFLVRARGSSHTQVAFILRPFRTLSRRLWRGEIADQGPSRDSGPESLHQEQTTLGRWTGATGSRIQGVVASSTLLIKERHRHGRKIFWSVYCLVQQTKHTFGLLGTCPGNNYRPTEGCWRSWLDRHFLRWSL